MLENQRNGLTPLATLLQDRVSDTIRRFIQRLISEGMIISLDCQPLWIQSHNFLKALWNRLLDLVVRKLDKGALRMKTVRLDRLLFGWKLTRFSNDFIHRDFSRLPLYSRGIPAWATRARVPPTERFSRSLDHMEYCSS